MEVKIALYILLLYYNCWPFLIQIISNIIIIMFIKHKYYMWAPDKVVKNDLNIHVYVHNVKHKMV